MTTQLLPRTATGRFWILVFRDGRYLRSIGVIKRRLSIGSGVMCDVSLDDPALPAVWGTIADKGPEVVLEPTVGPRSPFPLHEPVAIGAFTLVRVPVGTDLAAAIATIEARLEAGAECVDGVATARAAEASVVTAIVVLESEPDTGEDTDTSPAQTIESLDDRIRDAELELEIERARMPPPALERPPAESWAGPASCDAPESLDRIAVPSRDEKAKSGRKREKQLEPRPAAESAVGSGGGAGAGASRTHALTAGAGKPTIAAKIGAFSAEVRAAPPPPPAPRQSMAPASAPAMPSPQRAPMAPPAGMPPMQAMSMPMSAPSRSKSAGTLVAAAAGMAIGGVAALAAAVAREEASSDDGGGSTAIARRTTVRHYTQMNPGRTFPLLVIISAGKVERVVLEEVAQVESEAGFTVTRESPMVRIEPVLPGCAVAPSAIDLDCTADLAEARFHVTPIVEGDVPEARIEVRHEGKVIDQVPIPTRVAKQTVAKVSATFSAATPFAMQMVRLADKGDVDRSDFSGTALGFVHDMAAAVGGPTKLGLLIAVAGALIALVAYLRNRAKEGSPIVRFLDYSAQVGSAEDLAVEKLKARLAIFCEGARRLVPILKRRITIGSDAGCDIVIRHRSVAPRHAEIRIEGPHMSLAAIDGAPLALHGVGATGSIDLAGKDEVAFTLGTVPCLYAREVPSADLDDGEARAALMELLERRLAGAEQEVGRAFADRGRPVRAAVLLLMSEGRLDLETWLLVRRSITEGARATG